MEKIKRASEKNQEAAEGSEFRGASGEMEGEPPGFSFPAEQRRKREFERKEWRERESPGFQRGFSGGGSSVLDEEKQRREEEKKIERNREFEREGTHFGSSKRVMKKKK